MHLDVSELSAFYQSDLGRIAQGIVAAEIAAVWPHARAERVVGLGHATPYLAPFVADAERVIAVMPAAQGVMHWPRDGPNLACLAYEDRLPLPDNSVEKVLLVHLLEATRDPEDLLREVWRVLMPTGRVIVIVPYRAGAWARADHTPMGSGRPFSRAQLALLMENAWLEPVTTRRCLYVPPVTRRMVLRSANAWERLGGRIVPRFAGLVLLEARKMLSRTIPERKASLRDLVPALGPVARPATPLTRLPSTRTPRRLNGEARTPPARQTGSRTTTAR